MKLDQFVRHSIFLVYPARGTSFILRFKNMLKWNIIGVNCISFQYRSRGRNNDPLFEQRGKHLCQWQADHIAV